MSTVTTPLEHSQARGRLIFCLLAVFFALPVIIVTMMYKFEWHPQGSSQGELIAPPTLIELPAGLLDVQGKAVPTELLRDKWSMVYVTDRCADTCMERVHTMRQLHASMAKDSQRIQRILITLDADWKRLQADYPDMLVINQPAVALTPFARQFHVEPSADTRIYLVDPLANLMMSFPETVEAKAIRKDLVRLLKAAWAG
jgi:hypothetical protein